MVNSIRLLVLPCFFVLIFGCSKSSTERDEAGPPSNVESREANSSERLGIVTAKVQLEEVNELHRAVGWLELPPGTQHVLRSPVTGFVASHSEQSFPEIGQVFERGGKIVNVNVFLTAQELSQLVTAGADAKVQMQQAFVTMQISESQLNQILTAKDAVTGVRIDQLKESIEHSKIAYEQAKEKLPFLIHESSTDGILVKPLSVECAITGKIVELSVAPGQFVVAGEPLMTVSNWEKLWLRVPLFEDHVRHIKSSSSAEYHDPFTDEVKVAKPVVLRTFTKPLTRTVDYWYEIENKDWQFRVGQALVVELPVGKKREALTIPLSAVLYNSFGQPSCFVSADANSTFVRRRIELGFKKADRVEVIRGVSDEEWIVAIGAEQLAAEESKTELIVEDDE